jgi:hypothetical protein
MKLFFQWDKAQRSFVADKLMDTANWGMGVLFFGQLVTKELYPLALIGGALIYVWFLLIAVRLKKGGDTHDR